MPDYAAIDDEIAGLPMAEKISRLEECLPQLWCAEYEPGVSAANILAIALGGFTFLFDFASGLEPAAGETIQQDRVVAAYGTSSAPQAARDTARMKGFLGKTGETFGPGYDKGHFIAHSMGGDIADSVNWFPQSREVNQGKPYRALERYCAANPGTFFFSRPLYEDLTWRPARLEIGLLRKGRLESHLFSNRASA